MSYYISPRFLDKLAVHITKNFLDLPNVRVPLLLGIHGRKGEGKSFQCELVFERLGVEVVHMSAGELESPDAGDPARLIRLRYREAAELVRTRGKMTVLMINDLDAGAGRLDQGTQYTVNTQLVNGTLMNIADNPTNVQLPGSYDSTPLHRVPIIITGNDLSTLYAPLIRDGRMDKFYWEPNRDDKIGIVGGIFEADAIQQQNIEQLVDHFINQSVDFFGALRSRLYDEQVLNFIKDVGYDRVSLRVVNSGDRPPEFHRPDFSLPHLIEVGEFMVQEQQRVQQMRLSEEYNRNLRLGFHRTNEEESRPAPQPRPEQPIAPPQPANGNRSKSVNQESNQRPQPTAQQTHSTSTKLNVEAADQVQQILAQGYRLGIEFVDERRFRTNSWQSYAAIQGHESEAIAALEACLAEHSNDYVRVVGIDPKAKRRMMETVVQRPNGKAS
ncbi:ribulose bisphosphate carboxylase small subunit [Trichocoleus sp. FACHB-262]|uniref:ribulose bisphosphate carboxylase small subunit n=1 Tax=Trichocoleus sp. FACHB-262 TaxID=2692869 RepID=UPI00168204A5|nr:ribulose bisphosphate carboxylase small subunit [Trichocoleus sp. FACHB-262]MBD2119680.1 ribulose bisphosphate carboxylase small subunit [Trichocoleus sp. FACHB-262]